MLCEKYKKNGKEICLNQGFTLVEMSIVLVIIGFILAGILGGTSLIDNAKRQSVITDVETYRIQIEIFEDQYSGLPGDLFNAEEHWPDASYNTDNGNGDGVIELTNSEVFLVWEHLYLANLIPFAYSGTGANYIVNNNVPESQYQGKGFRVIGNSGIGIYSPGNITIRQRIELAAPNGTDFNNSALLAKDAEKIDEKIDDGYPTTGNVVAMSGSDAANNCVNTTQSPNTYLVRSKEEECIMFFFTEQKRFNTTSPP